jgi:hypothetical protein
MTKLKSWRISGFQNMYCIIPSSDSQVQTNLFSEANFFNTTYIVHLYDEEYHVEKLHEL